FGRWAWWHGRAESVICRWGGKTWAGSPCHAAMPLGPPPHTVPPGEEADHGLHTEPGREPGGLGEQLRDDDRGVAGDLWAYQRRRDDDQLVRQRVRERAGGGRQPG